jgi:SH3 domain-containing YSC84-like protein 1
MTAGGGFGGQIGFELTDFVFILNDRNAVKTFAQAGSITLGGNVSIAAGPVGRNAEAAGAASLKSVAGIFSYSKTKGLFAGVSLEGSAIIERKDANEKLYGQRLSAQQLLSGEIKAPSQAHPLMTVLNSRIFSGSRTGRMDDGMYNDIPTYGDDQNDVNWNSPTSPSHGNNNEYYAPPKRAGTWHDDEYDRPAAGLGRSNTGSFGDDYVYRDRPASNSGFPPEKRAGPGRPTAPKPNLVTRQATQESLKKNQAIALFKFDAAQAGDLAFEKGAVIDVISTDGEWW